MVDMVRAKHMERRKKDDQKQQLELRQLEGEINKLSGKVAKEGLVVQSVVVSDDPAVGSVTSPTTA